MLEMESHILEVIHFPSCSSPYDISQTGTPSYEVLTSTALLNGSTHLHVI